MYGQRSRIVPAIASRSIAWTSVSKLGTTTVAPPTRPQGQWALDGREALNSNERVKAAGDGLAVRKRIEDVYSKSGFDSIDPDDLHGRFRWMGLYTQRRPGVDGGRTATLTPDELSDRYFMLRIRTDAGQLNVEQLRAVGEVAVQFARNTADVTDRQSIQLHWVRIEDMPEIWRRLESVGLTTTEACGDAPRVVLGSPVAGVAADEIIDGSPAIAQIVRRFVGDPRYSNLPRKFKTAVSGSPHHDVTHEINCVSFVGIRHPEFGPGFDVWVGGGLSTNPMLAQRLGAWASLADVPDVWEGVVGVFRDYGYRRSRNRARLKFLVADWGPAKFRNVLEQEYLKHPLADGPAPPDPPSGRRDHVGVHRQVDGRYYIGASPTVGRVSGTILTRLADIAARAGSDRIRLSSAQKVLLLDVDADDVDVVADQLERLGLQVNPSEFQRGAIACTGIEYCKLAIVETKARARVVVEELERRLPLFDQPVGIHVNGCPNSCARFQTADIGIKGCLTNGPNGMVEGFQVQLGGELGPSASFGRKLSAHKLSADEMADYVERVVGNFGKQRNVSETFSEWVRRAEEDDLR